MYRDLSCALESLHLPLHVWDSKHRRGYSCMAEVDLSMCCLTSSLVYWQQRGHKELGEPVVSACAVQQDSSTRGSAKLTSARPCELNTLICMMFYWHC